jgi:hypothetical protein
MMTPGRMKCADTGFGFAEYLLLARARKFLVTSMNLASAV